MAAGDEEKKKKGGLQLLDFWMSPFGQRCRIALDEKGLAYEYLEQDLREGSKSDLLLRSNPVHKKIPVLLHNGRPVCESHLIVQYIDESFPSSSATGNKPPLLPSDPYARAQALFWADYVDKKVYDCGTRLWTSSSSQQQHEQARDEMVGILKTLDGALGDRPYFGGEDFGFVDVAYVPFTSWFLSYERYGGFSVDECCPGLAAWAKRCARRDSVSNNLQTPETVYDFIGVFYK